MKLNRLGEFNFIQRIKKGIYLSDKVIEGIGDDAAILKYSRRRYLLFTCDMLVEGIHFYRKSDGYLVGKKALSCSISDIAAMGGIPEFCVISIALPPLLDISYVDRIYKGIFITARRFNVDIVGGDTVSSEKIIIDIALIGSVEKENVVLRSGAQEKDMIFVTGSIGGSIKGKHLTFTPRLREARFLVKHFKINSMIDVSDGLLADLGHILESSQKGALLYERYIPLSNKAEDIETAIRDGEDYELIFTLSEKDGCRLRRIWPFRTRLSHIGRIVSARKGFYMICKDKTVARLRPEGFRHF